MPAAREMEADAPGAGAEVDDRAAALARESLPELQVGAVAAVLGVVPDDVVADAGGRGGGLEPGLQRLHDRYSQ